MSVSTPHSHLGFPVQFDPLEPHRVLAVSESTWKELKEVQDKVDLAFAGLRGINQALTTELKETRTASELLANRLEQAELSAGNLRSTNEELSTQLADAQAEIATLKGEGEAKA